MLLPSLVGVKPTLAQEGQVEAGELVLQVLKTFHFTSLFSWKEKKSWRVSGILPPSPALLACEGVKNSLVLEATLYEAEGPFTLRQREKVSKAALEGLLSMDTSLKTKVSSFLSPCIQNVYIRNASDIRDNIIPPFVSWGLLQWISAPYLFSSWLI